MIFLCSLSCMTQTQFIAFETSFAAFGQILHTFNRLVKHVTFERPFDETDFEFIIRDIIIQQTDKTLLL